MTISTTNAAHRGSAAAPPFSAMPRTMAEVEALLPGLGYSASNLANVRAAVRKCARAYRENDLGRIPADAGAFERKWGRGRVGYLAHGFKTEAQFIRWRKDVLAVLRRLAGRSAAKTSLLASWAAIVACVRENQGKGRLFGPNVDLSLRVLACEASACGRGPDALDPPWIDATHARLTGKARKSFRRGIVAFNRAIAWAAVLPEIAAHLPGDPAPEPTPLRAPASGWTRRVAAPALAPLWTEFDAIVARKRHGESGAQIAGEPSDFDETSENAYQRAVEWLLKWASKADAVDLAEGPDLAEVVTYANLVAATNAWIEDRKARGQPADKSSLHGRVTKLVHLATAYLGVSEKERRRLLELRKNKAIRTKSVGRMSVAREAWIREFDVDLVRQRAAHRLPETLRARASAILARLGGRMPPRPTEVMDALRMGVAAMMAAVLFRASPIRATNLRSLRFRGEGAHFRMDEAERSARIVIPGAEVKNGVDIDDEADDDLWPILRWYLAEIRPRLVAAHPFNRPYRDSDHLFPSTTEAPMEASMAADWYGFGCAAAGLPMTLHQARHVSAYWILSEDPNAWVDAAAVLHVDEMTLRKHYAWMSEKRANEAGRAKLRERRKASGRHRKGDYADAA